jgi:nitrous oxidase accessory protein
LGARGARAAGLAALLGLGCAAGERGEEARLPAGQYGEFAAARPERCREIPAGARLQAEIDAASPGDALCLAAGVWPGPLRLARGVALFGPREAVIRSDGQGTTVRLEADGAALLGLTVDGSGARYDLLDAAVHVQARDARVEGVRVRNATYGILVERSERALVRGNEVTGDASAPLGLRGDGIRLWETRDSRVEDNLVRDSRDLVVWYSPRNRIARNRIERGRYGTHLMYSHQNRIERNLYLGNVTGVFLMYSREIEVSGNLIAGSGGAAGMGIGLKESGNVRVEGNLFLRDTIGAYIDASPLWPEDRNRFEGNVFRLGEAGVVFHAGQERNAFLRNDFRDNAVPVRVEGRGDALGVEWRGNFFDDYAGYDLDGDGKGDLPYQRVSLSSSLTAGAPALAFFAGTPALAAVEAIGRIVPIFLPTPLLVDPEPRMAPPGGGGAGAG